MTGTARTFHLDDAESGLALAVDELLEAWMVGAGAARALLPPLLPAAELDPIDYFGKFPHIANVVGPVDPDRGPMTSADLSGARLGPADLAVPSAACYGVYLGHRGRTLPGRTLVTSRVVVARNEREYVPLRRLRSYHVREYVYLGDRAGAREFLASVRGWLDRLLELTGLDVTFEAAVDSFYDADSSVARLQKLSRVKEEVDFHGLAVGSLNYHRNFFGESYGIRDAGGEHVHTACFGAGLERWVAMLAEHAGGAREGLELLSGVRDRMLDATAPVPP